MIDSRGMRRRKRMTTARIANRDLAVPQGEACVGAPRRYAETVSQAVAEARPSRKVRTSQGKVVGESDPGKPAGKCHRKHTADGASTRGARTGKGEKVR